MLLLLESLEESPGRGARELEGAVRFLSLKEIQRETKREPERAEG